MLARLSCLAMAGLCLAAGPALADGGSAVGTYLVYLSLDGAKTTGGGASQVPYHPTVTYQKQQSYVTVTQAPGSTTLDIVTVYPNLVWTNVVNPGKGNLLISGMPPMVVPVLPQSLPAGFVNWSGNFDGLTYSLGDVVSADTNSLYGPLGEWYVTSSGTGHAADNLQWGVAIQKGGNGRIRGMLQYLSEDSALFDFFNPAVPNPLIQRVP